MLIIPAEPFIFPEHTALAINFDIWESIIVRESDDDRFQLAFYKDFGSQSNKWYVIATFDTPDECVELFHAIVEAIENGDKVFRIKKYLEATLKDENLPTV